MARKYPSQYIQRPAARHQHQRQWRRCRHSRVDCSTANGSVGPRCYYWLTKKLLIFCYLLFPLFLDLIFILNSKLFFYRPFLFRRTSVWTDHQTHTIFPVELIKRLLKRKWPVSHVASRASCALNRRQRPVGMCTRRKLLRGGFR